MLSVVLLEPCFFSIHGPPPVSMLLGLELRLGQGRRHAHAAGARRDAAVTEARGADGHRARDLRHGAPRASQPRANAHARSSCFDHNIGCASIHACHTAFSISKSLSRVRIGHGVHTKAESPPRPPWPWRGAWSFPRAVRGGELGREAQGQATLRGRPCAHLHLRRRSGPARTLANPIAR